jgi:hypothetical protein
VARIKLGGAAAVEPKAPAKSRRRSSVPVTEGQKRKLRPLMEREGALDIEDYFEALDTVEADWLIAELSYPQFRKVEGEWAVLGDVNDVTVGPVEVNKKDLTRTTVQIKRLGGTRQVLGRTMVYGFTK